jgi:hypothetical protein
MDEGYEIFATLTFDLSDEVLGDLVDELAEQEPETFLSGGVAAPHCGVGAAAGRTTFPWDADQSVGCGVRGSPLRHSGATEGRSPLGTHVEWVNT